MKIENIERVLVYREMRTGEIWTQEQIQQFYPIVPDGSMEYFGIVQENLNNLERGTAMSREHRGFMDKLVRSLNAGGAPEKTVIFGLEPKEPGNPYDFVSAHLELMRQLARDVQGYQSQAAADKTLNVVMRYASEMNGNGEVYSGARYQPEYKRTFAEVRNAVKEIAPDIQFAFSPWIIGDIDVGQIAKWWPGNDNVDVIGGTWYLHGNAGTLRKAIDNMKRYYTGLTGARKPFGIDEFGGANSEGAVYSHNDEALQMMLPVIAGLRDSGVSFSYGLLFIDEVKWGSDVTLNFLRS